MKIVHLNHGRVTGGAASGALQLHRALLNLGLESDYVVTDPAGSEGASRVHSLVRGPGTRLAYFLIRRAERLYCLNPRLRKLPQFSAGRVGSWVQRLPLVRDADIFHLHWVQRGMLSTRQISRLRRPTVWTLRDMWAFTGGCHISNGCTRYLGGCGACPMLGSGSTGDRTRRAFATKQELYARSPQLHPVGISPWVTGEAERSGIFGSRPVRMIWNGVDLGPFQPVDRQAARRALGLDPNRRYLSTGSINLRDPYKGFGLLAEAMKAFARTAAGRDVALLVFGKNANPVLGSVPNMVPMGTVTDKARLNQIYAASEAFLLPSLMEPFGKTCVEALLSGTPVVCFDTAGPAGMVEHRQSGFKATPFDPQSFAEGIAWALKEGRGRDPAALHQQGRRFSAATAARAYRELYRELLNGRAGAAERRELWAG